MLCREVLMGCLGPLSMVIGVETKMKQAKQIPHIAFCYECAWWQSEGNGRYGYCIQSGKKVPADKMAAACQGARSKSQQPIKHTQKDNKNIYYDLRGNARRNNKVPERHCKSCGQRLSILQWNSSGSLYMKICRHITCADCDRPQGSYMVLEKMASGLWGFTRRVPEQKT